MTFRTSRRIWLRAAISFSSNSSSLITSAASVVIFLLSDLRTGCGLKPFQNRAAISCTQQEAAPAALVRQRVNYVVYAKPIGVVGILDRLKGIVGPLPPIAHVIVEIDDHHQASLIVCHAVEDGLAPVVRRPNVERFDREETIEDRMAYVQFLYLIFRQSTFYVVGEIAPLPGLPEVIHYQESASQKVFAHSVRLFIGQVHIADLAQVSQRVLAQVWIVEPEDMFRGVQGGAGLGDL